MRKLFSLALVAALFQLGSVSAQTPAAGAQTYPAKQVRFIVPFGAGGGVDIFSRTLAQRMREQSGYTIVVENLPGADGNIGADLVSKASPDGYTVLMSAVTLQIINTMRCLLKTLKSSVRLLKHGPASSTMDRPARAAPCTWLV
jgi:tripartite-type tricarboxylate transporter receptor subunit TctC